ncbi:tyrosine-type recombinase/integrase [Bacillus wiedmannii]|uniref:tyrosine-type recombinase/integrase n=1 Tax=Bacillus wiedmannii TaxID=1890302 RepID=UPI00355639DC
MENRKIDFSLTNMDLLGKDDFKTSLSIFSSDSSFEENIWIMDKVKKAENYRKSDYSYYFSSVPELYKDFVKFYILLCLIKGRSHGNLSSHLHGLITFFKFIDSNYGVTPLKEFTKQMINHFEIEIRDNETFSKATKESIWSSINGFFKHMVNFNGMPNRKLTNQTNPFSRNAHDRLVNQKFIPISLMNRIDDIFMNKDILHHIRTIYWICRLIPSRINEVTTVPIDCLKEYRENEFTLTLHMYKQNGGYIRPELRVIHLKYDDMGKYLIDLIRKQKEISLSLQEELPIEKRGLLFTYEDNLHKRKHLLTSGTVRKNFNKILAQQNVVDESNNLFQVTPHQLRHNAITDRIYEGFSLLEIRDMTAHKSNTMLEGSYIHPEKNEIKKIGNKVNQENEPAGGVYFKGKIINADNPIVVRRLLSKPRAHQIGRLGICSDITGCKNDMFECFTCSFFVPNADELDYFKEQVTQWEKKVGLARNNPLLKENAEYNLKLSKAIVEKIEFIIIGGDHNE